MGTKSDECKQTYQCYATVFELQLLIKISPWNKSSTTRLGFYSSRFEIKYNKHLRFQKSRKTASDGNLTFQIESKLLRRFIVNRLSVMIRWTQSIFMQNSESHKDTIFVNIFKKLSSFYLANYLLDILSQLKLLLYETNM